MPVQGADFRRMRNARGDVVHKGVVGGGAWLVSDGSPFFRLLNIYLPNATHA
jgi:hypothetical protein